MRNGLEIHVQLCKDCYLHTWCSRHDQNKYNKYFQAFKVKILQKIPHAQIIKNIAPSSYRKLLEKSNIGQGKYYDTQNNKIVYFPRFGSFEISIGNMIIYSKLSSSMWPNIQCICKNIEQFYQNFNKNNEMDGQFRGQKGCKNGNFVNFSKNKNYYKQSIQKQNKMNCRMVKNRKIVNNKSLPIFPNNKIKNKLSIISNTINFSKQFKINNPYQNINKKQQKINIYSKIDNKIINKKSIEPQQNIQNKKHNHFSYLKNKNTIKQKQFYNFQNQNYETQIRNQTQNIYKYLNQPKQLQNHSSVNAWSSKISTPVNQSSCENISKTIVKEQQFVKCPSIDVRIIKQQKNLQDHIIEIDYQNTNLIKQQQKTQSNHFLKPINRSQQTILQNHEKNGQNIQENEICHIPFSYLMPTKMQQWSASASIDQSSIENKLVKSETISSNDRTNILNKLQYASSCFKYENPTESQLTIKNNQNQNHKNNKNKTFHYQTVNKINEQFYQNIEQICQQNQCLNFEKDILCINQNYDQKIITETCQGNRDIQVDIPQFRFSKNTFISDVYTEQIQNSYIKCQQTDSQLFPEETFKQINLQINQNEQYQL